MKVKLKLLVTLLVGISLIGVGVYYSYSTFSQQWGADEKVEATVLESELQERTNTDTYGSETHDYRVYVNYSYTYEGEKYTNDEVSPGLSVHKFDDKEPAEEELEKYPPGEKVTAYIDPKNPGQSYLVKSNSTLTLGVSALLVLLGLFVTLFIGGMYLNKLLQPDPEEVNPDRNELRNEFRKTLEKIEDYPVEDYSDIRSSSIDLSQKIKSNDFEITVRGIDNIMKSKPDTPCRNAEELSDHLINEMEEQGYFY